MTEFEFFVTALGVFAGFVVYMLIGLFILIRLDDAVRHRQIAWRTMAPPVAVIPDRFLVGIVIWIGWPFALAFWGWWLTDGARA